MYWFSPRVRAGRASTEHCHMQTLNKRVTQVISGHTAGVQRSVNGHHELAAVRTALLGEPCHRSSLAGSGPTLFEDPNIPPPLALPPLPLPVAPLLVPADVCGRRLAEDAPPLPAAAPAAAADMEAEERTRALTPQEVAGSIRGEGRELTATSVSPSPVWGGGRRWFQLGRR